MCGVCSVSTEQSAVLSLFFTDSFRRDLNVIDSFLNKYFDGMSVMKGVVEGSGEL